MITKQTIAGRRVIPLAVEGKINGQWVAVGPDIPVPVTDIRRVIEVEAGHVYIFITEFLGGVQVISRANPQSNSLTLNQVNTFGRSDSPISVDVWDITGSSPSGVVLPPTIV